ncbi:MAG: LysM peptidoglycan-binding domain-containing protein [Pseudomonadota bacterium]
MRSQYRLSTLIASALFLQACGSTLSEQTDTQDEPPDRADQSAVSTTVTRGSRIRVRQSAEDSLGAEPLPAPAKHVWEHLAGQFSFSLRHYNQEVEREIGRYTEHPDFLREVTERAAPFIYEISQRIAERDMPSELALLPIVESAYNTRARSGADAAGLWQFMAPTAEGLGLKRDWWYDGRLDPMASTDAALDYLQGLHEEFDGDWLLALAAYNAGRGTVGQAMRRNQRAGQPTDFWSLPLPRETREHVPRLLALTRIFLSPAHYGIELAPIPLERALTNVEVGTQIDLRLAADLAGMDPELVHRLNPAYSQWMTHPDGPHTLLLPPEPAQQLIARLDNLDRSEQVSHERYQIRSGDSLGAIASRFNTSVNALRELNNLGGNRIIAGEELLVPRTYQAYGPDNTDRMEISYTVRPGDSLWEIATEHQLSVDALRQWNQLSESTLIHPGQELIIRPNTM